MIVKFAISFALAVALAFVLEVTNSVVPIPGISLVEDAQARVGRPLTPTSVAGVSRRTSRRCAAGVYNC